MIGYAKFLGYNFHPYKTREALVRSAHLGSLASPGRQVRKLGEVAIAMVSRRWPGETVFLE